MRDKVEEVNEKFSVLKLIIHFFKVSRSLNACRDWGLSVKGIL